MRALNNNVVVKYDADHEKIGSIYTPNNDFKYSSGKSRDAHIAITGTVLAVPESLNYYGKEIHELWRKGNRNRSMNENIDLSHMQHHTTEYDVPMELKVGDRVWFSFLAKSQNLFSQFSAVNDTLDSVCEDVTGTDLSREYANYGILKYHDIIIAKRGETFIPLNGCLIVEPVLKDTLSQTGIVLHFSRKEELSKSKVIMCGALVKGYRGVPHEYDSDEIKEGHIIYHDITTGFPLESELFAELPKNWRYLWRKDILTYE